MRKIVAPIAMALIVLASCAGKEEKKIELPSTTVMGLTYGWGVVLTNYVRIRATPALDGVEVTALAKGAVVKVLDKGRREIVKGSDDFWYEVEDRSSRGWLFGAHLKVFHTKPEAEKAVLELK